MAWQAAIAGLTLGMLSSFHCVGMCGPIVMALPVNHLPERQRLLAVLLYHAGRVATYITLGALFAMLGRGIYLAGWQQYFSIVSGVVMLIIAVYSYTYKKVNQPLMIKRFYIPVQKMMAFALRSGGLPGFLLLGVCNGLLPCGMVYMAIAGSMVSTEIWQGVLFMGMYGLGTIPAMLLISIFSYHISLQLRNYIKRMFPLIAVAMAILFILRGMNLGIPFISPVMPQAAGQAVICH